MPEPKKYVTPAQLEALKDAINAAGGLGGGGGGGGGTVVGLSLSGSTLTLTKPDGTVEAVYLPSGGGTGEVPALSTADLDNLMGL